MEWTKIEKENRITVMDCQNLLRSHFSMFYVQKKFGGQFPLYCYKRASHYN